MWACMKTWLVLRQACECGIRTTVEPQKALSADNDGDNSTSPPTKCLNIKSQTSECSFYRYLCRHERNSSLANWFWCQLWSYSHSDRFAITDGPWTLRRLWSMMSLWFHQLHTMTLCGKKFFFCITTTRVEAIHWKGPLTGNNQMLCLSALSRYIWICTWQ